MIVTSITHWCPACQSTNIVKNGHTTYGQQRCLCHGCGKTRVLVPRRDSALDRFMEKALRERISLRGIARVFGVSLQTVLLLLQRLAQALPALRRSLMPAQANDILELDELYSFVGSKKHKRWLWVALCRRTRQVVAYVIGDRSEATCRRLLRRIPSGYRRCASYSDFWAAYAKVFQSGRHQSVDKASGETAHVERWNCTLRQRVSRYVRKTLSFSKIDRMHHLATKYFVWHYNLDCIINTF